MRVARVVAVLVGALGLLFAAAHAEAVEYRLRVANLYRDSFAHFIDGPIGTGSGELAMPGLEHALDSGDIGAGALLWDRPLTYGWDDLVRSMGAVKVRARITPGGEAGHRWEEAVWEGQPGQRSVWVIRPLATSYQEVYQVAVKGAGAGAALRYYIPYRVAANPKPQTVVAYPLVFMRFYGDRGGLWDKYLSKSVSLADGIGVVVGINDNPSFADWVYVIVEHPSEPTTFETVVGWERRRSGDRSNFEGVNPVR